MKTHRLILALGLLTSAAALAGCAASSSDEPTPKYDVVRSSLARDTNPILTPTELDTLTKSQADFSVDMLKAVVGAKDENVFLSPHSIATALAMTYAGAQGETAAEMKKALHFDLGDRQHAGFNHLGLALASRGNNQAANAKRPTGTPIRPFALKVANSLWGQKNVTFEAPFLDTLAVSYGAGVNVVDFGDAETSRLAINGWVEDNTEKRIKDLLPKGSISGDTQAVLVNTVYFNASWANAFTKEATTNADFTKLDGSKSSVVMMNGEADGSYKKAEGYEAITLPYFGDEVDMLTIVPDAGTFKTFESSLTGGKILDILAGLEPASVVVSFPKLKLESNMRLRQPLTALGMSRPFGGSAQFAGMTKEQDLFISEVFHNTFLAVDEEGTEAAGATGVVMAKSSAGVDPRIVMRVDRPFITAIVDKQTKTLLFLGRIVDPK